VPLPRLFEYNYSDPTILILIVARDNFLSLAIKSGAYSRVTRPRFSIVVPS